MTVPSGSAITASGFTVTAVDVSTWSNTGVTTTVDTTGAYAFRGLTPGRYALRFDVPADSGLVREWYSDKSTQYSADAIDLGAGVSRTGIDATLGKPASISGTVAVPSGASAAGISVTAYDPGNGWVTSTSTDASGRYSLLGLTASSYRLSFTPSASSGLVAEWYADKKDLSSATPVTVGSGENRTGTNATLVSGASLSGRVTVPSGVTIAPYSFRAVVYDPQQRWVGNTYLASDGTYRLAGLAAGTYRLQFDAPSDSGVMDEWYADAADFASAQALTVAEGEARTGLDATLTTGASIAGRVSVPSDLGADLTNVRVEVSTTDYRGWASASVASDGTYRVGGLAAGVYTVKFAPGYGSAPSAEWWDDKPDRDSATTITLASGAQKSGVDATLARGATVAGTVSVPPGQSAGGVAVYAYTREYTSTASTYVGTDGTYRLSGLAPGTYRLRFASAQNSPLLSEWYSDKTTFSAADPITVAAGDVRNAIDASLSLGGAITGVVTVPAGKSIGSGPSAIRVTAQTDGGSYAGGSTTVGPDGRYTITGLAAGTYRVSFDAPADSGLVDEWYDDARTYTGSTMVTVAAGATRSGVNAALAAGTSISGKVTLPAGIVPDSMQYRVSAYGDQYSWVASSEMASDGSYSMTGLAPGTYRLEFTAPPSSGVLSEWYSDKREYWAADAVTVTLDAPRQGLDVELARAASFSGRVVADTGAAVAGASVTAFRRVGTTWEQSGSAWTDSQGNYALSGLIASSYTLRFAPPADTSLRPEWWTNSRDQATATSLTLASGQSRTGLDVTLDRGATVAGTVRYTNGNAVSGAEVAVFDRSGAEVGRAATDTAGRYAVTGLDAVAVTVGAVGAVGIQLEGGASTLAGSPSRTLSFGSTTTVDLSLAGRTVSGTVRIAGSTTPLGGGTVTLSSAANTDGVSGRVGTDGRYRLVAVPAGAYVAKVTSADAGFATTWSDGAGSVEDADYFRVGSSNVVKDLTIARAATITGTTDAAAGGWQWVQLLRWNGFAYDHVDGTSTSAGSRFSFTGLAPGQYTLRISNDYYGGQMDPSRATRFTLTPGNTTDVGVFQSIVSDGGALEGTITGATGTSTYVTASDTAGNQRSVSARSVDGVVTYSFPSLPRGTYTVHAEAWGYPTVWFGGSTKASARGISVTTGGTARADLKIAPGAGTLVGTVTRSGTAAAGTQVSLVETSSNGDTGGFVTVATGADGSYTFAGQLVPGRTYRVKVFTPTGMTAAQSDFTAVSGVQRRDLTAYNSGGLRGTVVDESTGAPVANAPVQAFRDGSDDRAATAQTDSAGRYSFGGLPPGLYRVKFGSLPNDNGAVELTSAAYEPLPAAHAPEWLPDAATAEKATPLRVTAGATVTAPSLKVGTAGVVAGTVSAKLVSGSVVWVDDAEISLYTTSGALISTTESPRAGEAPGAYSLAVAPGTYTVCAELAWWAEGSKRFGRTCSTQAVVVTAGKRTTVPDIRLVETSSSSTASSTSADTGSVRTASAPAEDSGADTVTLLPDWSSRGWQLSRTDAGAMSRP